MPSQYRPESRSDPYDASMRNLQKARASAKWQPPRPWRSPENHARSGDSYTSGLLAVTATSPLDVHGLGSLASPILGYKSSFGNFRKIRARCSERLRVAVIPHLRNLAERGSTPR